MTAHRKLPVRRPRHDGWTAERQEPFIKAPALRDARAVRRAGSLACARA